jgi:hypothetical protein
MRSLFWRSTNSISELEASLAIYEPLLWTAAILALLGVVLEVIADRHTFRDEAIKGSLKKLGEHILIFGWILEIAFGIASSNLSGLVIAKLRGEAAKADERTAVLQAQIQPRALSIEQQRQIATAVARFSGHKAMVSSYGLDGEGDALGAQIIGLLRSAIGNNNVVDARSSVVVTGGFERGIHVRGPMSERDFASVLGDALSGVGKLQTFVNDATPNSTTEIDGGGERFPAGTAFVTVTVGIKPVPVLALP